MLFWSSPHSRIYSFSNEYESLRQDDWEIGTKKSSIMPTGQLIEDGISMTIYIKADLFY